MEETRAAARILESGGNAFDAIVAGQAVLALVNPESNGRGADAVILVYYAGEKRVYSINAEGTAPKPATIIAQAAIVRGSPLQPASYANVSITANPWVRRPGFRCTRRSHGGSHSLRRPSPQSPCVYLCGPRIDNDPDADHHRIERDDE